MHAVVVNVTLKDAEAATAYLREQIVPRVAQAPGLVNAYWADSGSNGGAMIVFESEDAANAMAESIRGGELAHEEAVTLDSIEVREVKAHL
jgi:hypothetical protein